MLSKVLLAAGFIFCSQLSFAGNEIPVPIPPDNSVPPGQVKPNSLIMPVASATISDTELAVYFDWSVGDATIKVYDESNQLIYQETVDTDSVGEVFIPVDSWDSGIYTITVTYGTTTQRGSFAL